MKVLTEVSSSFFSSPEAHLDGEGAFLEHIHSSEGGFSELYRINRMGRFRVLKCLKPAFRGNPTYEGLLRKEFEIGFSLDHPNICQYYAFQQVDGLGSCIEMEWIDGQTLEHLTSNGSLGAAIADSIIDQICDALSYIHSKQVLHKDLKPSNILVTHKGNVVKLIDFGLSDSSGHSVLKIPAGTAVFTAPEVLKGADADVRSEVYSLGLVIASLGPRHRFVVRKCCEPRPGRRYASVSEVKKALHSNWPFISGILFILLVAVFALYPLVSRWFSPAETPSAPEPESVLVDTTRLGPEDAASAPAILPSSSPEVRALPGKSEKAKEPATAKPSATQDQTVDESLIDELFRQATDLFE